VLGGSSKTGVRHGTTARKKLPL